MKTVELEPGIGAGAIEATFVRDENVKSVKAMAATMLTIRSLRAYRLRGALLSIKTILSENKIRNLSAHYFYEDYRRNL
jgi:hypothetical protein